MECTQLVAPAGKRTDVYTDCKPYAPPHWPLGDGLIAKAPVTLAAPLLVYAPQWPYKPYTSWGATQAAAWVVPVLELSMPDTVSEVTDA